jgi:hypothetical protein
MMLFDHIYYNLRHQEHHMYKLLRNTCNLYIDEYLLHNTNRHLNHTRLDCKRSLHSLYVYYIYYLDKYPDSKDKGVFHLHIHYKVYMF